MVNRDERATQNVKMFQTQYDANEKIWSGPDKDSSIDKTQNFGEIILKKLSDDDLNRVMQVN